MKTVLRWIAFPAIFLVSSSLLMFVSAIYFDWLLPLETIKDWIIFALIIPLSGTMFVSVNLAGILSISILPERHSKAGFICILIISVLYLIAAYISHGLPSDFQQRLNCLQMLTVTVYLTYWLFKGKND